MRNPLRNFSGFKPPARYSKLQNPLTDGEKVKRLKKMHVENLASSGLREPGNPLR